MTGSVSANLDSLQAQITALQANLQAQINTLIPVNGGINYTPGNADTNFPFIRSNGGVANDILVIGGGASIGAVNGDPNFIPVFKFELTMQENDGSGTNTCYLYRGSTLVKYYSFTHANNASRISRGFLFIDNFFPTSGGGITYKISFDGNNSNQGSGINSSVNWYFSRPQFQVQWLRRSPSPQVLI